MHKSFSDAVEGQVELVIWHGKTRAAADFPVGESAFAH